MTARGRFRTWWWKEAREHRTALLAVSGVAVLLGSLPFVVLHPSDAWEVRHHLPSFAMAIAAIVLGLDLFAREVRTGTQAMILRTPGALRASGMAKGLLFLVSIATVYGLATLARAVAMPARDDPIFGGPIHGLPPVVFGGLVVFAASTWIVAGSTWVRRGGAASLVGLFALAALLLPLANLWSNHPWWFGFGPVEAFAWASWLALVGLVVAGLGWFRGRRFLVVRRGLIPSFVMATVALGATTAGVAWAVARWEEPDPDAPELRILSAQMGVGSRFLFLNACRGADWGTIRPRPHPDRRSTPVRAWVVDLEGDRSDPGTLQKLQWFVAPPRVPSGGVTPVPFVARQELGSSFHNFGWLDARDGRFAGWSGGTASDGVDFDRAVARETTPYRDAQGRRVWMLSTQVEVDGAAHEAPSPAFGFAQLMWDGWLVSRSEFEETTHVYSQAVEYVRWQGGRTVIASPGWWQPHPARSESIVHADERVVLGRSGSVKWSRWVDRPFVVHPIGPGAPTHAGGWPTIAGWDPFPALDADDEVDSLLPDLLARTTGRAGLRELVIWRLSTDETRAIEAPAGFLRADDVDVRGRAVDGRFLVTLRRRSGTETTASAWGLLDATAATLTPLTEWLSYDSDLVAFEEDKASIVIVEESRRIARHADAGSRRTVLFPPPR